MRVQVDRGLCTGHARCHAVAPDVYELDDLGYNAADGTVVVPTGREEAARLGAAACPERAIHILDA
ncbi:MAG TPA: ferredoxin [Acidimicrobiales bacterium]|jgi:ferredoxin